MTVTQIDEPFPFTRAIDRSPGLHLMDIVKDMATCLFKLGQTVNAPDLLQFEKGYVWERVLSRAFGDEMADRPGEIVCDGVACSPDGVRVEGDGTVVVEEYKCTTMSASKSPEDIWVWKMQAIGYCRAVGVTTAVFRVFYLMGEYKEMRPMYRVWRVEFTENEITDGWVSIVNHARMKGWL